MMTNHKNPLFLRPFYREWHIVTSKSSGPGGQHVNKTESRVELRFNIDLSQFLSEAEKLLIKEKLKGRITLSGDLVITAQVHRSQIMNREEAEKRFIGLITQALKQPKKRHRTKPSAKVVEKRIKAKKELGTKKVLRRKGDTLSVNE